MRRSLLVSLGILFSPTLFARPASDEFSNPIIGIVILGLVLLGLGSIVSGFFKDPIGGIRIIAGLLFGFFVGIGIPIYLSINYEIGGWLGVVWLASIIGAGRIGLAIAGVSEDDERA